jgi:hypothetical protein
MDDWITNVCKTSHSTLLLVNNIVVDDLWIGCWQVYGPLRTFHSKKIGVYHHTQVHGQRYKVDKANSRDLLKLIKQGRMNIRHWMATHDVPKSVIIEFEHSMKSPILLGQRDLVALKLKDVPSIKKKPP